MSHYHIILTIFFLCSIPGTKAMDPDRLFDRKSDNGDDTLDECENCKDLNHMCRDCRALQLIACASAELVLSPKKEDPEDRSPQRTRREEESSAVHQTIITPHTPLVSLSIIDPNKQPKRAYIGPPGGPQMQLVMPHMVELSPESPWANSLDEDPPDWSFEE